MMGGAQTSSTMAVRIEVRRRHAQRPQADTSEGRGRSGSLGSLGRDRWASSDPSSYLAGATSTVEYYPV